KTLDHRCLARRETSAPAACPDTGESGEAESRPQSTDFDPSGFGFRRAVARPLSVVRNGYAGSFGSRADSGQAAPYFEEAGQRSYRGRKQADCRTVSRCGAGTGIHARTVQGTEERGGRGGNGKCTGQG